MCKKLKINKITYQEIFQEDFKSLINNNAISFIHKNFAIIYGPNGTGKTSLAKVFSNAPNTSYEIEFNGQTYTNTSNQIFHVINDQNNRNVIAGTAQDFFLGDNIREEFELKEYINKEYERICTELVNVLKKDFNISAKSSKLIPLIKNEKLKGFISDIANKSSKGKAFSAELLVEIIKSLTKSEVVDYIQEKLNFFINDYNEASSLLRSVLELKTSSINPNKRIREVEENDEAVRLLTRFDYKNQCIVCDTDNIDPKELINRKTNNKQQIIASLDDSIKKTIEQIAARTMPNDLFNIKSTLMNLIETGNIALLDSLKEDINAFSELFDKLLTNAFLAILSASDLVEKSSRYYEILSEKIDISEEDFIYIEEIINNNIDRKLKVDRDERKNIKIYLDGSEFLGKERNDLPLSTGEQNFLSLSFEFLKAKNAQADIVILDDPISSFDSIYKNKIAYAIIKMLQSKNCIILSHNIDLIRLLDGQHKQCFSLYLFNNTQGELNGFIKLARPEQEMLIYLDKLLAVFRKDISSCIKNKELFLISMIPFMRGYAQIFGDTIAAEALTNLMHGYKTAKVDVAEYYKRLFKQDIQEHYNISVQDILDSTVDGKEILNKDDYPLLNRTLRHSFTYLFLRLLVEKTLVEKYSINTDEAKQLGKIIRKAFPSETDINDIKNRVFLTSKKTLLNEFNHFEGNLSIFQPALDISDSSLLKEKDEILKFINKIKGVI